MVAVPATLQVGELGRREDRLVYHPGGHALADEFDGAAHRDHPDDLHLVRFDRNNGLTIRRNAVELVVAFLPVARDANHKSCFWELYVELSFHQFPDLRFRRAHIHQA
jgi:hypothetical protein